MGEEQDPEVIEQQIEETRARMGERVDARSATRLTSSRGSATRSPRSGTP
ncbi:MAG: hypothetical protein DLM67_25270 [Candidatus Nephthysia bennettiae]|nr:MAG: hypothetical protein DLM67_25270 [Candidatus Dormibacteraeota bacterium]